MPPIVDLCDNVQLILDQLSLNQRFINKDAFIIQKDERQYTVSLENLPEVRIKRTEPLECFEWHDSIRFAQAAANYVNDQACLAKVLVDTQKKTVGFQKEFSAQIGWPLGVQFYQNLEDIDQTVTAFREACSMDDKLFQIRLKERVEKGLL